MFRHREDMERDFQGIRTVREVWVKKVKPLSEDYLRYIEIEDILWLRNPEIPHHHKALYQVLLRHENIKTLRCFPCQEDLALHLKTSSKSISRWARELELTDLIRIREVRKGKKTKLFYDLYAPRPNMKFNALPNRLRKDQKVVSYPSQTCTNSTSSTIPQDGVSGYMCEG